MKPINYMAATCAAMMLVLGGQAYAADLGGNCCADLEERIAELEATTARKGNRQVTLEVSGQVHEAVLFLDVPGYDGPKSRIIPGAQSQSRFRVTGKVKLTGEWSAGYLMEFGVGSFGDTGENNRDLTTRHSALYIKSKSVGTIWLGHTSLASDGAAEMDLSRSSIASVPLSLSPVDGAVLGVNGLIPFDGGRASVVKYVSPDIGGFSVSGAVSTEDVYDAALRYAGEFGSVRLAGAIAYRNDNGPAWLPLPNTQTIVGSASIMELKSGLFANVSYGNMKLDGVDDHFKGYAVRGGIEGSFDSRKVTVYGEWARIDAGIDTLDTLWGGGIVTNFGALDIYLSGKQIDIDGEKSNVGMAGAMIKF